MQVSKEQYEYYLVFVEKFKKQCPSCVDQDEFESFLNYEFCKIVYSFFQKYEKNETKKNIEHYINASLKKAIIYKYYATINGSLSTIRPFFKVVEFNGT